MPQHAEDGKGTLKNQTTKNKKKKLHILRFHPPHPTEPAAQQTATVCLLSAPWESSHSEVFTSHARCRPSRRGGFPGVPPLFLRGASLLLHWSVGLAATGRNKTAHLGPPCRGLMDKVIPGDLWRLRRPDSKGTPLSVQSSICGPVVLRLEEDKLFKYSPPT